VCVCVCVRDVHPRALQWSRGLVAHTAVLHITHTAVWQPYAICQHASTAVVARPRRTYSCMAYASMPHVCERAGLQMPRVARQLRVRLLEAPTASSCRKRRFGELGGCLTTAASASSAAASTHCALGLLKTVVSWHTGHGLSRHTAGQAPRPSASVGTLQGGHSLGHDTATAI
jgi:hypothetical protein